jgi:hypothetical protein
MIYIYINRTRSNINLLGVLFNEIKKRHTSTKKKFLYIYISRAHDLGFTFLVEQNTHRDKHTTIPFVHGKKGKTETLRKLNAMIMTDRVEINGEDHDDCYSSAKQAAVVVHDQLPSSAEEVKSRMAALEYRSACCSKMKLAFSLLVILAVIGISTIIGITLKKQQEDHQHHPEDASSTSIQEGEPTAHNKTQFDEIVAKLVSGHHVDANALATKGTPQNRAAVWLARTAEDEDQDMISISMMSLESFLQRYVLMVLFYSTSNNDQGWLSTLPSHRAMNATGILCSLEVQIKVSSIWALSATPTCK